MAKVKRETLRKRIIRRLFYDKFKEGPILLEEFRWCAYCEEKEARGEPVKPMSRSFRHSFNRTLKEHCVDITTYRSPLRVHHLYAGLVARTAVYRLMQKGQMNTIPSNPLRFYFFHEAKYYAPPPDFKEKDDDESDDFMLGWDFRPMKSLLFLTCLLQIMFLKKGTLKSRWEAYVCFPYTSNVMFVANSPPEISQIRKVSEVPWDLRLVGQKASYKVAGTTPVGPIIYKWNKGRVSISLPEGVTIDRSDKGRSIQPISKAFVQYREESTW